MEKQPVAQDTERFKLLFTNSRPLMPTGYEAPLEMKSSCQRIREQREEATQRA